MQFNAIHEAARLFLATASDAGTLRQVLEEAGYEQQRDCWLSPAWVAIERRSSVVAA